MTLSPKRQALTWTPAFDQTVLTQLVPPRARAAPAPTAVSVTRRTRAPRLGRTIASAADEQLASLTPGSVDEETSLQLRRQKGEISVPAPPPPAFSLRHAAARLDS